MHDYALHAFVCQTAIRGLWTDLGFQVTKSSIFDAGSTLNEEDANKTKIKDKLKKFLPKRPTYYELEKKGIIKRKF